MLIIQILLILFLLFAVSRVVLRFRDKKLHLGEFIFWAGLFIIAAFGVIFPNLTTRVANILGIGRGADLIIYGSIATLFYLVFRLYILLEDIRHEITEVVRKTALHKE